MEMKHRGMCIARQLSFKGVSYQVYKVAHSPKSTELYDKCVKLWSQVLHSYTEAAELVNADPKMFKTTWNQFWLSHQRFFKYLRIAAKVKYAVELANEAIKCGKCVVIGLQSIGEAWTLDQIEKESEVSKFVSTAKGVLQTLIDHHFPDGVLHSQYALEKSASLSDQQGTLPDCRNPY